MKRKISTQVVNWFDARLAHDPLALAATENGDARRLMLQAAVACLGVRESPKNRGKEVESFQKTVGLDAGDMWCMCFVQTCIAYAEHRTTSESPVLASGACMPVWNNTALEQRVKNIPLAGAIAIWQHTKDPTHGHTGIVLACDGVSFHGIEGNTADGYADLHGSVGSAGDGVRYTHRRVDLFNPEKGDMQLRGFIRPF